MLLGISVWLGCGVQAMCAEPDRAAWLAEFREPSPLEDDAQLHDVRFVGSKIGWAVGDRGVIWNTTDGGASWHLQPSGVDCPLYAVCFLTSRVGWAAGGGMTPFTRVSYGVLLHTQDGGVTWNRVENRPPENPPGAAPAKSDAPLARSEHNPVAALPRLHGVRFFSPDDGYIIGEATSAHPTGVLATRDGGQTWRDLAGPPTSGWRTFDCFSFEGGAVAGLTGRTAQLAGGKLLASRQAPLGLRGLHALRIDAEGTGWLAGDGGLVLTTENSGLVWQAPHAPLPPEVPSIFDFYAVCRQGPKVWVAGRPGSCVWHSPDSGRTWRRQPTGQPLPLSALAFSTDDNGWAVGALGVILRTSDGGKSWQTVHGAKRRLAMMTLHTDARRVSFNLIAQISGELGYRTLASVLSRGDIGPDGAALADLDVQLGEAVSQAGGSAAAIGWQLPLDAPGLDRNSEKLADTWNRRTEGRLDETLQAQLVCLLRTWRPSVLVVDQPAAADAAARLVNDAVLGAVGQAADPARLREQIDVGGLEPWSVARVFTHAAPGAAGHVHIDPFAYLPRLKQPVQSFSASAYGVLSNRVDARPLREAYRLTPLDAATAEPTRVPDDFFAGLYITPGSPARRDLPAFDDAELETRQHLARKQRNFAAIVDRFLTDPRQAAQLIAGLSESVRGLPEAQAALQLSQLADAYLATGQWELAEQTFEHILQSWPDQPVAVRAQEWLMQCWGSDEMTWRRLKQPAIGRESLTVNPEPIAQRIQQAAATLQRQAADQEKGKRPALIQGDLPPASGNGERSDLVTARYEELPGLGERFRYWQSRALKIAEDLERRDSLLFGSPAIQLPLAAIHRKKSAFLKSDEMLQRFTGPGDNAGWSQAAANELWLSNPNRVPDARMAVCARTTTRPVLDGEFSEPCWQAAQELSLAAAHQEIAGEDAPDHPYALLCCDETHLYFAARIPRAPGVRNDPPAQAGRTHDEDLADFDRISLVIDTNRDYTTWYRFDVDQRGHTAESLWNDPYWNPQWFVAAAADDAHWQIEAAIPLRELTPAPPAARTVWAIGLFRAIPAVGAQSWIPPAAANPHPENFGFLQFE